MKSVTLGIALSLVAVAVAPAVVAQDRGVIIGLPDQPVSAASRASAAEHDARVAASERAMAQQALQAQRHRDARRARTQAQHQESLRNAANALRESRRREAEALRSNEACAAYRRAGGTGSCASQQ